VGAAVPARQRDRRPRQHAGSGGRDRLLVHLATDHVRPPPEPNPALARHAQERAQSLENRIADRITAFAGSMKFVYIHVLWFSCWIAFGVEEYPFGLLTMIVSLEAIFLSTFVMISQNRADRKRQVIADQQWETVKKEDRQNEELLVLSRQILDLLGSRTDPAPDVTPGVPTARRRDDGRRS
jgi:Protein of unknown function (DUF1003)